MCVLDAPSPPEAPRRPPEPPRLSDPNVTAARTDEKNRLRAMSGRSSTIVTGASGTTSEATTTGKRLLGE